MEITLKPIAFIKTSRKAPTDDFWEEVISEIHLADYIPTEALQNISHFSHLEIIYYFDKECAEEALWTSPSFSSTLFCHPPPFKLTFTTWLRELLS